MRHDLPHEVYSCRRDNDPQDRSRRRNGAFATSAAFTVTKAEAAEITAKAVLTHYAELAHAKYEDSLITAKALDKAINTLIAKPSEKNLIAARQAWIAARVPYQQSEVYRFGNPIVDEWEGKVNAWPLDEGLIDYVDASYGTESNENAYFTANVIAHPKLTINGETIDASKLTPKFLRSLHEAGKVEANVATGYHAIEFLLWGRTCTAPVRVRANVPIPITTRRIAP